MKKLNLIKQASDFAFANIGTTDKLKLAEASLAAFAAGGNDSADLDIWTNEVTQALRQWQQIGNQKLPSEMVPTPAPTSVIPTAI